MTREIKTAIVGAMIAAMLVGVNWNPAAAGTGSTYLTSLKNVKCMTAFWQPLVVSQSGSRMTEYLHIEMSLN